MRFIHFADDTTVFASLTMFTQFMITFALLKNKAKFYYDYFDLFFTQFMITLLY